MKIVALAGGVGGAKLVHGFAQILAADDLTVIVNTGDDFHHWGLKICPDLDTVCYTVAGLANPETGWGRRDETWIVLNEVKRLQGEDWFRIGDRDLATHVERTERLASGQTLTHVTQSFCRSWGIRCTILPMSDDPIATIVDTQDNGEMAFQEYFAHQKSEPRIKGVRFAGIEYSRPSPGVLEFDRKCGRRGFLSFKPVGQPGSNPFRAGNSPIGKKEEGSRIRIAYRWR